MHKRGRRNNKKTSKRTKKQNEREGESNIGALKRREKTPNRTQKNRKRTPKLALFLGVASFAFGAAIFSLAAPPSSPYTPGETLNPTCSPGDSNCTVVAPPAGTGAAGLLTYWTATSTVSSSLSLFWDNPNIRLGIGTSQPSSTLHIIAGTTGATTLQLSGLPNQTGNLLSIGSSSGQRYFTLSSLGVASSTEFRSPSSTIDVLTLASASSTGNITIGGTFQANAGQTTLTSVSSTNLFGSGYLNFVSGRADLQAVSSTNFSASGYGLFATLLAQNAVGLGSLSTSTSLVFVQGSQVASTTLNIRGVTNQTANLLTISSSTGVNFFTISALGLASSTEFRSNSSTIASLYDFNGNKYATSSAFTSGVDTQLLFGQLGGGATSSLALTLATSTSQLLFSGSNLSIAPTTTSTSLVFIQGTQTGSTTLLAMGMAGQTANLLSVGSSSGQRYFTVSSLGLASSTEFRSPSSTIDTLTLASASSTGNLTIGGSFQSNAGQSTFSNVSSTNLDVATRFNFAAASSTGNLTIGGTLQSNAGQTTLASVSSTAIGVSSNSYFLSNLGIGTTTPGYPLHVVSGGGDSFRLTVESNNNDPGISLFRQGASSIGVAMKGISNSPFSYFGIAVGSAGQVTFGTASQFVIDQNGKVGIGDVTPDYGLDVVADVNSDDCFREAGTQVAGTCASDVNLKKNILTLENSLDKILQLRPVTFEWKEGIDQYNGIRYVAGTQTGLIAQEVEQVFPGWVSEKHGFRAISYNLELPLRLVKSVQELDTKIASLSFRVEDLERILANQATSSTRTTGDSSMFASVVSAFHDAYDIVFDKGLLKVAQIITDKFTTKELCIEEVCIGKPQLQTLLNNAGITFNSSPTEESTPTSTVEVAPIEEASSTVATTTIPE